MQFTVNGESRDLQPPVTIAGLLELLGVNPKAVVVEKNLKIIDRALFDRERIQEGDRIEIIRLVGGG